MKLGIAFAFVLAAGLAGPAAAQSRIGYTNTDANLRTGPDSGYPRIETVPYGQQVVIYGCINDWSWCDVEWRRDRGWMAAAYLETDLNGQRVVVIDNGPNLAWPILTFAITAYWYDHYRYRHWYRERDYWYGYRPPLRPPIRPPVHRPYPPHRPPVHRPPVNRPPVNRPRPEPRPPVNRPVPRPTPSTRPVTRPAQTKPTQRPATRPAQRPAQTKPTQRPATRPAPRPATRPAQARPAPQRRPAPPQNR